MIVLLVRFVFTSVVRKTTLKFFVNLRLSRLSNIHLTYSLVTLTRASWSNI